MERAKDAELLAAEELKAATIKTYVSQLEALKAQHNEAATEAQKYKQLTESLKSQVLIEKSRASAQEKLAVDTTANVGVLEGNLLAAQSQLGVRTRELEDLRTESSLNLRKAEEDKAALREKIRRLEQMVENYKNAASIRKPLVRGTEESQLLAAFRARLNHEELKDDLNEIDSPAKREILRLKQEAEARKAAGLEPNP